MEPSASPELLPGTLYLLILRTLIHGAKRISKEDLMELIKQGAQIVDVRTPQEFAQAATLNRLFWSEFEEQSDGSLLVTFPAPDLDWAASTILAYGPIVEVLEPAELRRRVQAWAQKVVEIYR